MVMQYRHKGSSERWKKYPGKDKLKESVSKYEFRLLNEAKTKVLVKPTNYSKCLKRFRQIEFFKRRG
jgi:hypothetical protein